MLVTGIEIFSGAGGMSVGAGMAGINTKLAIEIDKYAALTFKHNHPDSIVLQTDIRSIKSDDIKPFLSEDIDDLVLFGGPPCQGFSKSNLRTRNLLNANNWLFEEFLRITKLVKPQCVVLENVYGLIGTEKGIFLESIIKGLNKLGYDIQFSVLNAMDFGVPQNRERVFIVGTRENVKFKFPVPEKQNRVTVLEALDDLPLLLNGEQAHEKPYVKPARFKYAQLLRAGLELSSNHNVSRNNSTVIDRYKYVPQGGNWKNIPNDLLANTYKDSSRCHTGIYHRLNEDLPSVVIGNYRKNMLIHPWQDRGLSVREAARLQSFPDYFKFLGNLGNQQQQVGNAVPPLLAKAVFENIVKSFN